MAPRTRPYLFYSATRALCGTCLEVVDAKEIIEEGKVFLWKRCASHGIQKVLLADDVDYWRMGRERFLKEPEQVAKYNTQFQHGCPYDCGICPDHEQHGCLSLLEITDHCNLRCPTCYASSGPERLTHRSMEQIEAMLDRIVKNEGEPDVVQISGGEPTMHPTFFEVLDACRKRPIRHLMLNTNGVRLAKEPEFAKKLAAYQPRFEVYLQFDSLKEGPLRELRGADLRSTRLRALENLERENLSTTLVVTVRKGLNDDELGEIVRFALGYRCVRGVTFQPVQDAGRNEGNHAQDVEDQLHRLTLTETRRKILEQSQGVFSPDDLIPVPCHADCLAMAYAIRNADDFKEITPLTRYVPREVLIQQGGNSIVYEDDAKLKNALFGTFSTAHGPESAASSLAELLCCLPKIDAPNLTYDRVFRLIIMQFLDKHSMDLRSVRKSCVHIAHPDGERMIPFDTYNVLYRDQLEPTVLEPLRNLVPLRGKKMSMPMVPHE